MVIKRLGAQRFSGLEADVSSLPIDADLLGAIFNSTDSLKFWIFNGTVWNEAASGGITGINPATTILEHSTTLTDYISPGTATATSEDGANVAANAVDESTATFWKSNAGINESIEIDMGSVLNDFALAFYIDKVQTGITETQFVIRAPTLGEPTFEDNFDTNVWDTPVGTDITIDTVTNQRLNFNITASNSDAIVYDLQNVLGAGNFVDETAWVWRGHLHYTTLIRGASANSQRVFIGLSSADETVDSSEVQDGIGFAARVDSTRTDIVAIEAENQTLGAVESPLQTSIVSGFDKFVEVKRTSATTAVVQLYDDAEFTITFGTTVNLTITAGINNLRYIKVSNFAGTPANSTIIGWLDTIKFWNGISVVPDVLPGRTLRTINVVDLVDQQYNFIRFNGVTSQFITIEGSSGSSLVMAANDLQVLVLSDPPLITEHGHFGISGTDDTLPLDGGTIT